MRRPRGAKAIDDAAIERQLGTDDGEIDALALGERGERVGIAPTSIGDERARSAAMPALPGRADDRADSRLARELPGERVLAAAAADDEHLHAIGGNAKSTANNACMRESVAVCADGCNVIDASSSFLPRIRDYL